MKMEKFSRNQESKGIKRGKKIPKKKNYNQ
jgi:hypothetical protein